MEKYINAIIEFIKMRKGIKVRITTLPTRELGDLAIPCFSLAKELKTTPQLLAKELAKIIDPIDFITNTSFNSGHLNIFINENAVSF